MRPCFICTDAPVAQKVRQIQTKRAIQQVKEGQVSNGSQASTADVPARTESARATTVSGDRKRPWMLTPCQIRSSRSIGIPTVCNQPTWVVNAGAALTVADGDGTRRFAGRGHGIIILTVCTAHGNIRVFAEIAPESPFVRTRRACPHLKCRPNVCARHIRPPIAFEKKSSFNWFSHHEK